MNRRNPETYPLGEEILGPYGTHSGVTPNIISIVINERFGYLYEYNPLNPRMERLLDQCVHATQDGELKAEQLKQPLRPI